ncbi:MAG: ABC transporter permease [Pyrinomonadaceae bacterium]
MRSRRKHRLVRFTAMAATLGIACGVGALIVALALANGFRDEIRDKILRGTAHITAARRDGRPITNWREQAAQVSALDGVASVSATSYDGALLAGTDNASYAVLRGVDTENAQATDELRRVLIHGELDLRAAAAPLEEGDADHASLPLPTAIIGADLAARTNLGVGDVAKIISASAMLIAPESIPQQRRVRIAGIFRTGLFEYDATWVYLSLEAASGLAGEALSASALSIENQRSGAGGGGLGARARTLGARIHGHRLARS